jgi:hypothetical protein
MRYLNAQEADWTARKKKYKRKFFLMLSNIKIIIINYMCVEILTFLFIALSPEPGRVPGK